MDLRTKITAPEDQKLSPRAEQILKETLPLAPKDGSLQAKDEFLQMLVAKLQANTSGASDDRKVSPWAEQIVS
jgi:uncharacterized protein (DUF3084 family)